VSELCARHWSGRDGMTGKQHSTSWLVPLGKKRTAATQLICFPYAGGSAALYTAWPDGLPEWVDVTAVALPGRGTRFDEPPSSDFAGLVSELAGAIAAAGAPRLALFGHSLGALLAYEVARKLQARHAGPDLLFVSGRQAPGLPSRRIPIVHLPDGEFVAELRAIGGTPAEILASDELIGMLMPMLRADFAMAEQYVPLRGPRLSCPLVALGGITDPWVHAEDLRAWSAATTGPFSMRMFPGDHFYLHQPDRVLAYLGAGLAAQCAPQAAR
jgi:medium-chain acyl-[acyl-carrier-protein] hydrolase